MFSKIAKILSRMHLRQVDDVDGLSVPKSNQSRSPYDGRCYMSSAKVIVTEQGGKAKERFGIETTGPQTQMINSRRSSDKNA